MAKQKVLLLGASGSMGSQAFQELWNRKDSNGQRKYDIILLQRPSEENKKIFASYEQECGIKSIPSKGIVENGGLKIVWGDATNYEDMVTAVHGVDWVLCPMAFIAPAADHKPDMAKAVNTTAIEYIVKAIHEVGGKDHIKFVYTGSVAETGDRIDTIHMGRIGDPLKPSAFDFYACTKIGGERAVIESGLKYWASLRLTYIAIPDAMSLLDPIMYHQPIQTRIEMITNHDAGVGLINCLDVPEDSDFWRRVYNMGGGPKCRFIFMDYMDQMMKLLGFGNYQKIMERKWFALRNFHCQWYEDSHICNEYLHYWNETLEDHYKQVKQNAPGYVKFAGAWPIRYLIPPALIKKIMKKMTMGKDGTLYWYLNRNDARITAFYQSYEKYENIPDWGVDMPDLTIENKRLNHGYDESKSKLNLGDLKGAAEFRGGKMLSPSWNGDVYDKLKWKCAFDHEFDASPFLVLKAGHWCPKCAAPPWNYDDIAKLNPFFAQVWYTNHDKDEHNSYPADCYKDIL
jgi:nucleoside-diphosphate-sugar epimerase